MKIRIKDKNAAIDKIVSEWGCTKHEAIMAWQDMPQKNRKRMIGRMAKGKKKDSHWLDECPSIEEGKPCGHPGCLNHITHPCEGCGRVGGRLLK